MMIVFGGILQLYRYIYGFGIAMCVVHSMYLCLYMYQSICNFKLYMNQKYNSMVDNNCLLGQSVYYIIIVLRTRSTTGVVLCIVRTIIIEL